MPPKKITRSSNINNPITNLIQKDNINTPISIESKKKKKHPNKIDDCIKCNKAFISKYSPSFPGYINTCTSCNELSNKQFDAYGCDDDEQNTNNSFGCCENNDDPFSNTFDNLFFASIISKLNKINPIENRNSSNKNKDKDNNKGAREDEALIDETDLEYEWLGIDIKDIDDLIRIGQTYNPKKRKRYNLNLQCMNMLVEPLTELKNMIGMTDVKKIIFDQIIYYLQRLDDKNVDMLHTVIVGPPGVGKTQLTHIIAKIYNKLGFLKTDNVVCAKRDDLIGQYIGQTAVKTRKVLDSALGGVLLLDEVYALSPNSEKDFAREAIDMINVYLSEHAHDLVCIIAGYKKPTYENFLAHNDGLARRFTHHFEIKGYTAEELVLIYKKYLEEQKWKLGATVEEITPIIEKNLKYFPNFGGDMTTLFACCKKTHSKRLLLIPTEKELIETKKKIKLEDIEKGVKIFMEIKEKSKSAENDDIDNYMHMYS
jgi:AAA+ superfamily predicted ATPase